MSGDDLGRRRSERTRPLASSGETMQGIPEEGVWALPDAQTLAVEAVISAQITAGAEQRLTDYVARYPDQATAIGDLMREAHPEPTGATVGASATPEAPDVDDDEALSRAYAAGVQAALGQLFGGSSRLAGGEAPPLELPLREPLARVAETATPYQATSGREGSAAAPTGDPEENAPRDQQGSIQRTPDT